MNNQLHEIVAALLCGILFGLGLAISRLVDPAKVLGFLDVAGDWDPTLLVVMAAALVVYGVGYPFVRRKNKPVLSGTFQVPTRKDVDARLILGAAMFGIGWGLVGLCPGPALANLSTGLTPVLIFVAAMVVGAFLHDMVLERP
jgi:uncharacterized membrane protein YedE/YeeE